jgi:colanic acid/amylovoran biosynthesis glycosyltransferase
MTVRRVAYVVNVFPKLSETFIAGELAELRRRGVEVRILSLRRPAEELRHGIVGRAGLAERTGYEPSEFPAVLRAFGPDLLHAHFATEPAAAARELAAGLGVPFTFTAHGYDVYRRPPADFAARAAAAAAVVTVSEANARHLAAAFGVPRGHVRVIPCGVDTGRFRPGGPPAVPPHVVCVARLVPVKNLGLLLEAWADLRARGTAFRGVLVGDGPCRDELLAAWARLGLEGVVELAGAAEQDEVRAWWQRASVAVLASEREGMPVSLMEAAACGVPAVATAVGGVPELVEDGVTGLLAPAGDRGALAAALGRLVGDPGLAARMGRAARARAEERFSVRRQVDRLLALWAALVREEVRPCASR